MEFLATLVGAVVGGGLALFGTWLTLAQTRRASEASRQEASAAALRALVADVIRTANAWSTALFVAAAHSSRQAGVLEISDEQRAALAERSAEFRTAWGIAQIHNSDVALARELDVLYRQFRDVDRVAGHLLGHWTASDGGYIRKESIDEFTDILRDFDTEVLLLREVASPLAAMWHAEETPAYL
ncbi:hypothetical protein ACIGB8_01510 [Promicromonospora sukumoe]|uniref:hypothetical protein n=1 Tax=Promicromonospora sukumoe TaxID=88382 RepID=UPI0037C7421F